MNIMPAKVAGVDEIIMVTPPGKDGKVTPTTLVAAKEAGADKVYKVGGAQAIAAATAIAIALVLTLLLFINSSFLP